MKVFIANFGQENHLWPACLARSTIATFDDEDLWPLRQANDRDAYIAQCIETKKTAAGITPTRPVASRWFNLSEIISTSEGDLWIHRAKNELWWTVSRAGGVQVVIEPAFKPAASVAKIYVSHKPADAWASKSRLGNRLDWAGLHAKAREFLFTEGTLQQLSPDNAAYATALIDGEDLGSWHSRSAWKERSARAKREPVSQFNAKQRAVARMVKTAYDTVAGANGQLEERTVKVKDLRFAHLKDFQEYVAALVHSHASLSRPTHWPMG